MLEHSNEGVLKLICFQRENGSIAVSRTNFTILSKNAALGHFWSCLLGAVVTVGTLGATNQQNMTLVGKHIHTTVGPAQMKLCWQNKILSFKQI